MTEPATAPVPEEKKTEPAQPEGDLRAELARVRGRNNTLKIIAGVLLSLFIILSAVGFFVYRKIVAAKATFEEAFQSFPPPAQGYQPDYRLLPGQGVASSTSMPASTLGLFSGGLPGGSPAQAINLEQGERVLSALNKYADRPIVKEFLADLQKNPDMAAAFKESKGGNPLAVISKVQNARGMDKIMMKYAMRPEFMRLMMEVASDPEIKPFMSNMPGGMPGGMPQGGAVSVPSGPQPGSSQPGDEDGDGEMTFDPSVISGPAPKPAPAPTKKPRSPVDSD